MLVTNPDKAAKSCAALIKDLMAIGLSVEVECDPKREAQFAITHLAAGTKAYVLIECLDQVTRRHVQRRLMARGWRLTVDYNVRGRAIQAEVSKGEIEHSDAVTAPDCAGIGA